MQEKIYCSILREVCGKNIPKDFKHVKIQIPSVKGKLTINDIILNIRRLKQEDGTDFNKLHHFTSFLIKKVSYRTF